ncbi:hypothetical protein SteCoe_8565 [Stentor coeruleus]|uniref:Uncharacterized protein n=1 Tax=Stentor coeruleus TaxID=5963 RepID=A0A1R2CJY1_9CILI|nr:hypothetical protein SteCoe_8565 [Stentor coeruleus]
MNNFMFYDQYEDLMMKFSRFSLEIHKLKTNSDILNECSTSILSNLFNQLQVIQNHAEKLFDILISTCFQLISRSQRLSKSLAKSQGRVQKCLTLQQQYSSREKRVKLKNKNLTSSLHKLKCFMRKEVENLEFSYKKQQKIHSKLSSEYNSSLEALDKSFTTALDLPLGFSKVQSPNTSQEFSELMKGLHLPGDTFIDNSRISVEKNPGGWVSEYDSDHESKCETEDIKNAIKVLMKANLLSQDTSLHKLNDILDDHDNENLELMLQLLEIKGNLKNSLCLEDTTPMTSAVMGDNDVFQTILSPGHKGPIVFESEEEANFANN